MEENVIIKDEIHLEPHIQKKLVEDVNSDIAPRELERPNNFHSSVKENIGFYHPAKWGDDHYVWLTKLVQKKLESIIKKPVQLKQHWFNRYMDGDVIESHYHAAANWVTSYYFEAPEGSGPLNFPDENETIYPYTGLFVAHPGWMLHEVLPNTDPNIVRYNFVANWGYPKNND